MDYRVIYAKVVLHKGCALVEKLHTWEDCPVQEVYLRIAKKHFAWLKEENTYIGPLCDKHEF